MSTARASRRSTTMSTASVAAIPGLCTFTATLSPVEARTALYTCPSDGAAPGSGEIDEKTVLIDAPLRPSSSSSMARASGVGKGSSESCSSERASR